MKMANSYLHVETNQLRPLVEHLFGNSAWDQNDWGNMGSSANAINLDDIDGANTIVVDTNGDNVTETHYLLPIVDETKANEFRVKCGSVGLVVDIMTYEEALVKWAELKALRPIKTI